MLLIVLPLTVLATVTLFLVILSHVEIQRVTTVTTGQEVVITSLTVRPLDYFNVRRNARIPNPCLNRRHFNNPLPKYHKH